MFTQRSLDLDRSCTVGSLVLLLYGCGASDSVKDRAAAHEEEVSVSPAGARYAALVTVYKNPKCECCGEWAEHLRANGFQVAIREGEDLAQVRDKHGPNRPRYPILAIAPRAEDRVYGER